MVSHVFLVLFQALFFGVIIKAIHCFFKKVLLHKQDTAENLV